ncbi:MAG: hypothetical protein U5K71_08990 [Gracilimonas sp.]|nr:hypothetical protein [Gracilimonas sp.]
MDINFPKSGASENITFIPTQLYAALGGSVIIDKDGLRTKGEAEAAIRVGDLEFDEVTVQFTKRFAMALSPFGVQQGQADLLHQNRRIAYVNSSGFHLDPAYLTKAIGILLRITDPGNGIYCTS